MIRELIKMTADKSGKHCCNGNCKENCDERSAFTITGAFASKSVYYRKRGNYTDGECCNIKKHIISSQNTRIGVEYNRDEKCTCNNSAHERASYTWIAVFKLMRHE